MDKVSLNGVEIFPFDSEHVSSSIEILGIVMEPVRKWL